MGAENIDEPTTESEPPVEQGPVAPKVTLKSFHEETVKKQIISDVIINPLRETEKKLDITAKDYLNDEGDKPVKKSVHKNIEDVKLAASQEEAVEKSAKCADGDCVHSTQEIASHPSDYDHPQLSGDEEFIPGVNDGIDSGSSPEKQNGSLKKKQLRVEPPPVSPDKEQLAKVDKSSTAGSETDEPVAKKQKKEKKSKVKRAKDKNQSAEDDSQATPKKESKSKKKKKKKAKEDKESKKRQNRRSRTP